MDSTWVVPATWRGNGSRRYPFSMWLVLKGRRHEKTANTKNSPPILASIQTTTAVVALGSLSWIGWAAETRRHAILKGRWRNERNYRMQTPIKTRKNAIFHLGRLGGNSRKCVDNRHNSRGYPALANISPVHGWLIWRRSYMWIFPN